MKTETETIEKILLCVIAVSAVVFCIFYSTAAACMIGCWKGGGLAGIEVNPSLPEPLHSYVLTHETCHATHSDIRRANADFFYLMNEEIYCHWKALTR